jgi:hypothetical protein
MPFLAVGLQLHLKTFQGEKNINASLHMKDLNAPGNGVFHG